MSVNQLPLWVRKAIVDFVETGLAVLFALQLTIPTNWQDAQDVVFIVGTALLGALIAALRRAIPGFLAWLNEKLGTGESG